MRPMKRIQALTKKIRFEPEIPIEQVSPNPLNPRRVFREKDINDLCNSIIEMGGIIVPLVVFEITPGNFVLLDGERRLRAAKKLQMKHIPANVVSGKLTDAENLSTMFNIHMSRESWDPASRALAIGKLKELFAGISHQELSEMTGMNRMAIRDAERILSFPKDIVERCLLEGKPRYLRPSNLVEMAKAFEIIEQYLPNFFEDHDREKTSRCLVEKIDRRIIRRNTDFRLMRAMFANLPTDQVEQLIERLLTNPEIGMNDIYESVEDRISSKRFELFRNSCMKFVSVLNEFKFEAIDKKTALEATDLLKAIKERIDKGLQLLREHKG